MAFKKKLEKPKPGIGDTVGFWTITGGMTKQGKKNVFPCRCACGTERHVAAISIWNGSAQSCGCDPAPRKHEILKIGEDLQYIYDLISEGFLPPADGISVQGQKPTWSLTSIAKLIGVSEDQLIEHLRNSLPRFAGELALS